MQRILAVLLVTAAATVGTAASAQAQTFITPFAGATFGKDAPGSQLTVGASALFTGPVAGFELEVGYTPDFFNELDTLEFDTNSNLTTATANLTLGVQRGPVRPYGVAGIGVMRTRIDATDIFDEVSSSDWGVNIGAGVIGMFSEHVGLRADMRYIRLLNDIDVGDLDVDASGFDFWRGYLGVAFKF